MLVVLITLILSISGVWVCINYYGAKIKITDKGVNCRYLLGSQKSLDWCEIDEIGVTAYNGFKFIYFTKCPLKKNELSKILIFAKPRYKNIVIVQFCDEIMQYLENKTWSISNKS